MGNVHMEATQVNYREGNKKMSVAEAIKNAGSEITPEEKTWIDSIPTLTTSNAGKTDQTVIAPEFDAEAGTYAIGDLVMHEDKLYEFTSAHETPGDWDETEVTEKTVSDEIDTLKSGLTNLVKTDHFEATTSANGNFSIKTCPCFGHTIISMTASIKADGTNVICIPYANSADQHEWIEGAHVVSELAGMAEITLTLLDVYVKYI